MLPSGPDYFFSFFGILLAGGIPAPIYPPVRLSQLEDHMRRHSRILSNCGASILITVAEARGVAQLLKSQVPNLQHIVTVSKLSKSEQAATLPTLNSSDIALDEFKQRFARFGFRANALMPVYGLAESTVGLAFPPINQGPLIDPIDRNTFMDTGEARPVQNEDKNALRFPSCGKPLSGHHIRVVDSSGHELADRQGQLQFRGPSSTSGYYRDAKKTQSLFDGDWLESGDLAYIANGEVYLTGRMKDVIIHAGRNIYPDELEQAIGNVPGIRKGRVVVFGSKDVRSGGTFNHPGRNT